MKSDATRLLRRLRGQLFRASRLPEPPQTPWRRRRLLDSLVSHEERIVSGVGDVLRLTARIPYDRSEDAGGLAFPGGVGPQPSDLRVMARIAHLRGLSRVALDRIAVLDTETTSLLDKPEAVPFIVGLGHFGANEFIVEQFFMEDFESEPAMMKMIARRMRDFRVIFSYNGKAFDLPLLKRRFALQRLPQTTWKRTHWDILAAARRLWRKRAPSCSLVGLETKVFDFHRAHTIEMNRIPLAYHEYLGGWRAERLAAVFDHNAQDVLTTAAIAVTLARAIANPKEALEHGIADQESLDRFAGKSR